MATDPNDLAAIVRRLIGWTAEISVRVETLRVLLEQRGVFSEAEFETLLAAMTAHRGEREAGHRAAAETDARRATLLRLLEQFEGDPQ
jgi:hypothetical protein